MPFQLDPTFAQDPAKHFDTLQIHAGLTPDPTTGAAALPIYASAAFQFDSAEDGAAKFALAKPGNVYGRLTNVEHPAAQDIYTVTDAAGEEHMLPAVPEFVKTIDMENRRILITPIEGMFTDAVNGDEG